MNNVPGGAPQKIKDALLALPFFDKFDARDLEVLDKRMELKRYVTGEYVFREGEPGTFMGFVVQGALEAVKENNKGEHSRLALVKKGFTFGEMALVDHYARSASVLAKEPSYVLLLSQPALALVCDQHPRTAVKILQGVSRLLSLNLRRTSGVLCDYLGG